MSDTCLTINQQVTALCKNGQPGITEVILINAENFEGATSSDGLNITGITVSTYDPTGGIDPPYTSGAGFKFKTHRNSSTAMDEMIISIENGVAVHKPSVQFKISGMTTETALAFKQLSQAQVAAIVKSTNGNYWLIGWPNFLDMESGMLQFGVTETDFAGADITLSGINSDRIYKIIETEGTFTIEDNILVTV